VTWEGRVGVQEYPPSVALPRRKGEGRMEEGSTDFTENAGLSSYHRLLSTWDCTPGRDLPPRLF
jgi:hypothetical protein